MVVRRIKIRSAAKYKQGDARRRYSSHQSLVTSHSQSPIPNPQLLIPNPCFQTFCAAHKKLKAPQSFYNEGALGRFIICAPLPPLLTPNSSLLTLSQNVYCFVKETLIKSLSDFILGFLYRARNHLTRIASYLRKMMTKLCIKIHMKSDSAI